MAVLRMNILKCVVFDVLVSLVSVGERSLANGQCIYSTMTGYIFPYGTIKETHIIRDFAGDCELLCYKSRTCVAANVRRSNNGTIVCEFRYPPSYDYAFHLAVPAEDSKLIVRTSPEHFPGFENVALTSSDVTCSSIYLNYHCQKATDGSLVTKWTNDAFGVGEHVWIQVNFRSEVLVYRIDLFPARIEELNILAVDIQFTDGSRQSFSELNCKDNLKRDILKINPVSTTSVKVIIKEGCSTVPQAYRYGLKEVMIYGFML